MLPTFSVLPVDFCYRCHMPGTLHPIWLALIHLDISNKKFCFVLHYINLFQHLWVCFLSSVFCLNCHFNLLCQSCLFLLDQSFYFLYHCHGRFSWCCPLDGVPLHQFLPCLLQMCSQKFVKSVLTFRISL